MSRCEKIHGWANTEFFCFLAGKRENTSKKIIDKDGISRNIKDSVGVNYTMVLFTPSALKFILTSRSSIHTNLENPFQT